MQIKDLIPWRRSKHDVAVRREGMDPFHALQTDMNRAFSDFWRAFDAPMSDIAGFGGNGHAMPPLDMRETDKAVEVVVELPGIDERDLDVSVADGVLAIRGEKQHEEKTEKKGYMLRERSFGRVERVAPLPPGLDLGAAKAAFKNGVLTVTIPKTAEAQSAVKRIAVRKA